MKKFSLILLCISGLVFSQQKEQDVSQQESTNQEKNVDINLYLRSSFEAYSPDQGTNGMKINESRFEVTGTALPDLDYRVRIRLNRVVPVNTQENAPSSIDHAYIKYSFGEGKRWKATIGKQMANLGSWELYDNPTFEYWYSDYISSQQNTFATGATLGYQINPENEILLQVHNTTNQGYTDLLKDTGYTNDANPAGVPLQWNFTWKGKLFDERLQTIYTLGLPKFDHERKQSFIVSLGNKFALGALTGYLDLSHTYLSTDYFNGISTVVNKLSKQHNTSFAPKFARDIAYQSAVLRLNYAFSERWMMQGKVAFERGLNHGHSKLPKVLTKNNINSLALEYKPFSNQDFKFFGYYSNQNQSSVADIKTFEMVNHPTHLFGLGVLYFVNVF